MSKYEWTSTDWLLDDIEYDYENLNELRDFLKELSENRAKVIEKVASKIQYMEDALVEKGICPDCGEPLNSDNECNACGAEWI